MKLLPKTLGKDGFDLTLVRREGRAAIYRQTLRGEERVPPAFEVIIPNVYSRNFSGPCEPYESYPGGGEWGRKGWTFLSLEAAEAKLEALNARK